MNFNYQIVFRFDASNSIAFVGTTSEDAATLINRLTDSVERIELPGYEIVNVVYQPAKPIQPCPVDEALSEEKTPHE